jgi:hypothetical protein
MSRRERRDWVALDDLTDDQQAILLRNVTDWLAARAADLPTASDDQSWKVQVEEVAALGRLASGLRHGKILRATTKPESSPPVRFPKPTISIR